MMFDEPKHNFVRHFFNSHKQQPRNLTILQLSKASVQAQKNRVLEDGKFVMCAKRREKKKKKKQFCDESTTRFFHFACNELSNFPSSITVKENMKNMISK
jgi:ABC-type proline/glycine betaine transport system ATPase subunit